MIVLFFFFGGIFWVELVFVCVFDDVIWYEWVVIVLMLVCIIFVVENNLVVVWGVYFVVFFVESLFGGLFVVVDLFFGGCFYGCWVVGVGFLNLFIGFGYGGGWGVVIIIVGWEGVIVGVGGGRGFYFWIWVGDVVVICWLVFEVLVMFVIMVGGLIVGFVFGFFDFVIGGEDFWGSRGFGRGIFGGVGKVSGDFMDGIYVGGVFGGWWDS